MNLDIVSMSLFVILSVTINLSTVSFIGAYKLLVFALFTAGCLIGRMFIEEILH